MTQQEHDSLLNFTKSKYNTIFGNLDYKQLEVQDFFYNAFAKKPVDIKKEIVSEIYSAYRFFIGEIQRKKGFDIAFEKKCNICKKTKESSLFRNRYSNHYQFSYLNYCCKDCEIIVNSNKVVDKEKRAKIAKNWYLKNREICILRAKNWRENNIETNRVHQKKYREKNKKHFVVKIPKTKKEHYELNKETQLFKAQEKRRLSTEWWENLTDELKLLYLEKYGFKTANRNLRLKAYREQNVIRNDLVV